jgi:hypothetical protein
MIQNPLMRHADSSSQHRVRKTERAKGANAVAGEVQAVPPTGPDAVRSMISATVPCWRSARASARPAMPPPTIKMRGGSGIRPPTSLRLCAHLSEFSCDLRGVCLGRFGLDEKLSTQTQLAIVR